MAERHLGLGDLLGPPVHENALLERLRTVIDPELGVNIVDLGLVYGAQADAGVARIVMTTTTPACPIGSYLTDQIRWALLDEPAILDVTVEMTYDPPWSPDLMSDLARAQLGWAR